MAMINVTVGSNTDIREVIVDGEKTPLQIFNEAGIVPSIGATHLNGEVVEEDQLEQPINTLLESGVETCFLIQIVKGDGGR